MGKVYKSTFLVVALNLALILHDMSLHNVYDNVAIS